MLRRYFKQSLRILQYDVNNLGTNFCSLVTRASGGFRLKVKNLALPKSRSDVPEMESLTCVTPVLIKSPKY